VESLLLPCVVKPGAAFLAAFSCSPSLLTGAADAAPAEAAIVAGINAIASLFLDTSFSFLLLGTVPTNKMMGEAAAPTHGGRTLRSVGAAWEPPRGEVRERPLSEDG
jgi:hypothetical protein